MTHDIGLCRGRKPGRGNILLAKTLKWATGEYPKAPVLAQLGVACAAKELGVSVTETIGPPESETPLDRSTGSYNSLTVVQEQRRWCEEHGMFPALALTLTSPFHMPRVKWIMEREGFEVVPIPLSLLRQRDYMDPESLYFSVRMAGRTRLGMILPYLREVIARLLFLKNGWI